MKGLYRQQGRSLNEVFDSRSAGRGAFTPCNEAASHSHVVASQYLICKRLVEGVLLCVFCALSESGRAVCFKASKCFKLLMSFLRVSFESGE